MSIPPYEYSWQVMSENEKLKQKLDLALDMALNRYKECLWYNKLAKNIKVKISRFFDFNLPRQ